MAEPRKHASSVRWAIVGAVVVVLGGGVLLSRSWFHTSQPRAGEPTTTSSSTVGQQRPTAADFAAAPAVTLHRLPASAAKGQIALPWHELSLDRAHLKIVFASRPSCEQLKGVVIKHQARSVSINVVAGNIVGAPGCDIVPKLARSVVVLDARSRAGILRHAKLDPDYWPVNPFDSA